MNKEFIERIENKVNSIDILDKDPFVEESCKNIYRALLVVAENENPPINDISNVLNDTNKTIELLKKFDGINKEKYNGDLSYIIVDINNNQTLLYLIELLKQSMNITTDLNNINKSTDLNTIIDKFLNNEISATEIEEDINTNKIKFSVSNSKEYGEITRPLNKKYYEIFGKGITFYEDKGYPSREKCFISLLKAIENKKEVEYYYNEYLQGNNSDNKKEIKIDDININRINKILSSVFRTSQIVKIEKIDSIKFLPSKVGYTIEIKDNHDKFYYMVVDDELCYVAQVRENSIDGKIVYIPDDDYIPPATNEKNNSNIKEIYYDFVPYKQIGTIRLDLTNKNDFQPSSIELINNNWFNTAICQPRLLDSPDLLNSRFGESRRLFLRYENHTIRITCNLKKFIENLQEICDDIITIDSNSENSIDNKIIYTKKLGIIAYADFLKEFNDYYILAIHFDGKDSFDAKIAEISNTKELSHSQVSDKGIYTSEQKPWIEYLEIDEETGERKLRTDTPEEIVKKYNQFVGNVKNNNSPMSKIKNFFRIDLKNNNDVTKFAQEYGYKGAKYIGNWKEYKVYEPYVSGNDISFTGLPLVILVNDKSEIRMSTSDEAMAIIDDDSYMESFEENNRNNMSTNIIDQNVINNVVNNIDEKIKELESQKNNGIQNTSSENEIEINKQLEENLEEVRNFSILNKSEEELFLAKRKFINNWYILLTNQVDNHWVMNSSTYRVHIQSIIEAILRRNEDAKSKKELELLKQTIECIQNQNRIVLIKLVLDMKTLES